MRSLPFSRAVGTLLCTVGLCAVVAAHAASVATDPALPLLDVAFCATPSADVAGRGLFVSSSADCSTVLASPQSGCSSGSFAFNVAMASLQIDTTVPVVVVPPTYWCMANVAGPATMVSELRMSVVQTTPMYYFSNIDTTFTFNSATPVGSTMGFYYDLACEVPIPPYGALSVTATRNFTAKVTPSVVNVCGVIPSTVDGVPSTTMVWRNQILNAVGYTVSPAAGVRSTVVSGRVTRSRVYDFALSNSSTCSDLPPSTGTRVSDDGSFSMTLTEPAGEYYFCTAQGTGVYIPATNLFTVVQYGMQPAVAYAGKSIKISPALSVAFSNSSLLLFL